MMGTKERVYSPLPHDVSLEDLVPKDNFYRRLEEQLDLSFVRDLVCPLYARGGRSSVDPVVFFKLQLVMFLEDLRSERKLMSVVADRLSLRWCLGYDLHEPLPDHSSLTRIRERYGLSVFRCFFERIVEMCFEVGLVWGEELYFDATKVEANASFNSTRSRSLLENLEKRLKEHLGEIFSEQMPFAQDARTAGIAVVVGPTAEKRRALAQKNACQHRWISEAGRQHREVVRWGYRRIADLRVSTTDPDASPMQHNNKGGTSRLGYQTHYVVDGGKARVILDVLVTPAEVTENLPMLDLLFRSRFRWHLQPRSVTGDAAYGTVENVVAVEKAGIHAYMALPKHDECGPLLGKDEFTYDAKRDVYICPQGETLHRKGHDYKERSIRYAAKPSACNVCPLKSRCTKSKKGRWIRRSFDEEYLERVRSYRDTEAYRKALRKRAVWVEPLFAEAKDWHRLRRFRLRGLEKVNTEALLTAAGQNVKRLVAARDRSPRHFAQAAALRPTASVGRSGSAAVNPLCRSLREHRRCPPPNTPRQPLLARQGYPDGHRVDAGRGRGRRRRPGRETGQATSSRRGTSRLSRTGPRSGPEAAHVRSGGEAV
jgi:transposase